jgi:5-formyltetrahydrofolate cyclo-ligase
MQTPTAMVAPHVPPMIDIEKRAMRAWALERRAGLDALAAGTGLCEHLLTAAPPPRGAVVSGFWPIGDEIDIRPLMHVLHDRGHTVVLPITPKRGNPLTFGVWHPDDELVPEPFGTVRPIGPLASPDYLLVPLLAFDRTGGRLGYGAGFYDRTLALLEPRFTVGCAYAAQEAARVPMGTKDVRLDAVATEREFIRCEPPINPRGR